MLLLLLSIAAAPPVAVDVTGMEPQLEIVRREAAERGWRIGCEGRAGEERVIRIHFRAETSRDAVDSVFGGRRGLGSSHHFYAVGDVVPERCDRAPAPGQESEGDRVLAFGPREVMAVSADIARACGFTRALVRPGREDDPPAGAHSLYPDWFALDAGEEIGPRYGPFMCFIQMQLRAVDAGEAGAD
ncbi:MAG: hypothetical protein QOC65_519 [Sphingomonadales bacterium]|nr:hypothetical protein [Sphingomonadales bacterium]